MKYLLTTLFLLGSIQIIAQNNTREPYNPFPKNLEKNWRGIGYQLVGSDYILTFESKDKKKIKTAKLDRHGQFHWIEEKNLNSIKKNQQIPTENLTDISSPLKAYPNPSSEHLIIDHISTPKRGKLLISDLSGKVLWQVKIKKSDTAIRVDVSQFNNGQYILYLSDKNNQVISHKKILIQH